MTTEKRRLALAEFNGFTGCVDAECDYRKCQHLHKDGRVYFPETYCIPRYPNYPTDLNALMDVCRLLAKDGWRCMASGTMAGWTCSFRCGSSLRSGGDQHYATATTLAAAMSEAILRVIGKWEEE